MRRRHAFPMAHITDIHPYPHHIRQTAAQLVDRLLHLVNNVVRLCGRVARPDQVTVWVSSRCTSNQNAFPITNGATITVTLFPNRACAYRLSLYHLSLFIYGNM